jgi:hypothetical protein
MAPCNTFNEEKNGVTGEPSAFCQFAMLMLLPASAGHDALLMAAPCIQHRQGVSRDVKNVSSVATNSKAL